MTAHLDPSTPISQYDPTEQPLRAGEADVHPGVDRPLLHDLLHPRRGRWTPRQLRNLAQLVSSELTAPLLDLVEVDAEERWWARLGLTSGVELWLLSWAPGQGTHPHDHGGAAGSFAVLSGDLREDYRYPTGPVRTAHHGAGSAIGFGSGRAHQVRNTGSAAAASVHAYSPPLLPVNHYADLADIPPAPPVAASAGEDR